MISNYEKECNRGANCSVFAVMDVQAASNTPTNARTSLRELGHREVLRRKDSNLVDNKGWTKIMTEAKTTGSRL